MPEKDFYKRPTIIETISSPDEDKAPAHIPASIGPYKVESLLSKGGMSLLYLGLHPETHEPLTIKVLSQKYLSHPEMVDRFLKEAEIIALADHPNIVKLYGHGEWEGGLYIAMEFIQGISLRQFILQNTMSLRRALEVILQISYALLHLHSHGVIHRDLKPENVLLTSTGGIKVIDFGIAQLHSEGTDERITQERRVMGTPIYMSPEQKEDPLKVSFSSDIYSLGIICYELVLGRLSHGVILVSQMPRGLQKILSKTLQPVPKNRYQDVVDLITDVSVYMRSDEIKKDLKGADYLSEMSENLQKVQEILLPRAPSTWSRLEIGLISHSDRNLSSIYYDFIPLGENSFGILIGEPASKGIEGMIYGSILRGMVRAILQSTTRPVELVTRLNKLLISDFLNEIFTFSYVILSPNENRLRYVSCGYGPLWHISQGLEKPVRLSSNNIALGISDETDFLEVNHNWHVGDVVIFNTATPVNSEKEKFPEEQFQKALADNIFLPPQKQVEALSRKLTVAKEQTKMGQRPITLISILRKS